jgi:hypothetical protein
MGPLLAARAARSPASVAAVVAPVVAPAPIVVVARRLPLVLAA